MPFRLTDHLPDRYILLRKQIRMALRGHRAPAAVLDDLEQDAFVALLGLASEPQRAQLSTWIWSVCGNKVIDHRHRERTRSRIGPDDAVTLLSLLPGPHDGLNASAARSWVYGALWRLPPTSRRVVYLREIDDGSYQEIAEALHITTEAARVAHHRGMKRLRRYAVEHGP